MCSIFLLGCCSSVICWRLLKVKAIFVSIVSKQFHSNWVNCNALYFEMVIKPRIIKKLLFAIFAPKTLSNYWINSYYCQEISNIWIVVHDIGLGNTDTAETRSLLLQIETLDLVTIFQGNEKHPEPAIENWNIFLIYFNTSVLLIGWFILFFIFMC